MKRQVLVLFSLALLVAIGLAAAGCAGSPSVTSSTTTVTEAGTGGGTMASGQGLLDAKLSLDQILGVPATNMLISTNAPASPGADVVLEWQGGRAEVDSATGRVYLVSEERPVSSYGAFKTVPELQAGARDLVVALGWDDGLLTSLGFIREEPGTLSEGTGLYSLKWAQYDSEGALEDGFVEVYLDARTAGLTSFSLSLGSKGPNISGALGEHAAMEIAETEIYLKTAKPTIPLAGDGSLVLLTKSVSEDLKVISDRKITGGGSLLVWVITETGMVENTTVGGTVYIDATTGEVLKYVPVASD